MPFDITFIQLMLVQIIRHKVKIPSYLHGAFSSENYKAEV